MWGSQMLEAAPCGRMLIHASAVANPRPCRLPQLERRVISQGEDDVTRLERCAAGARIVIIGTNGLASMVMRGQLMVSVLNQSVARHGAQCSYILVTSPVNTTRDSRRLEWHFDQIGGPSACIILKYPVAWFAAACRRRGAVVIGDSIDNHRAFSQATFSNEHYSAMDAMIVQTEFHAAEIAKWGYTAIVLPHAHGNLGGWSVAASTRERLRGVGFVMSDAKNMPTRDDMRSIVRGCCRANTTLYVINSAADGMRIQPYHHNCSNTEWFSENASASAAALHRRGGARAARPRAIDAPMPHPPAELEPLALPIACHLRAKPSAVPSIGAVASARAVATAAATIAAGVANPDDPTRQRRFYESEALLRLIDVRLVRSPI